MSRLFFAFLGFAGILICAMAGCNRNSSKEGGTGELLVVPVAQPVKQKVADFVDYTGRTQAIVQVAIQARVTGFLTAMPFKEGANVKAGDILFKIDPRPYQAQLNAAESQFKAAQNQLLAAKSQVKAAQDQLEVYRAKLKYDKVTNERYKELAKKSTGSVAAKELDQYQANEDQSVANVSLGQSNISTSEANVALAEANLTYADANRDLPRLNLDWTDVKSPINGHISRYYLTLGNLVNQDSPQLTTIMSIDPMYAYFDMDEPTMLRTKQAMYEGKSKPFYEGMSPETKFASLAGSMAGLAMQGPLQAGMLYYPSRGPLVYIALQGEEGFQDVETNQFRHTGYINFIDNQVNAGTDSIQVRGVFVNTRLNDDKYLLVPGMFVRVRMPIGQEEDQLLVVDRAIISEQGQKKIYIVGDDNKVDERVVTLGPLLDNGLRVVSGKNFGKNNWVMYTSLQQVRVGQEVRPQHVTMPEPGKPAIIIDDNGDKGKDDKGKKGKR